MGRPTARVICNPSSGGGAYDPDELRAEFDGYELDWVMTEGPDDASEAAKEWREGLLIDAGGDGTIKKPGKSPGEGGFPPAATRGIPPAGAGQHPPGAPWLPHGPPAAEEVECPGRVGGVHV